MWLAPKVPEPPALNGVDGKGYPKGAHMSISFSEYVQEVLDAAPILTDEKRTTITAILAGGDPK